MTAKHLFAVSAVLACTALAACGDESDPPTGAGEASPTAERSPAASPGDRIDVAGRSAIYHGTEDITGAGRVSIDMADGYFSPTVLRGAPNQQIQLTLRNRGEHPHHFTTSDQQLIVEVQPGLTADGRVTLPASGNLSFYCLLHHRDGMAGGFNVSGDIAEPAPGSTPTGEPGPTSRSTPTGKPRPTPRTTPTR